MPGPQCKVRRTRTLYVATVARPLYVVRTLYFGMGAHVRVRLELVDVSLPHLRTRAIYTVHDVLPNTTAVQHTAQHATFLAMFVRPQCVRLPHLLCLPRMRLQRGGVAIPHLAPVAHHVSQRMPSNMRSVRRASWLSSNSTINARQTTCMRGAIVKRTAGIQRTTYSWHTTHNLIAISTAARRRINTAI